MISTLLLAALAANPPVEAHVTSIELQRPVGGVSVNWYNRVSLELASRDARRVRLCPGDVSVVTERRVGESFRPVDRFRAYAMKLGTARNYTGACRDIALAPGRPEMVTFIVTAVPGGRHRGEDRYSLVLDADWAGTHVPSQAPIPAP
jgi:hypothetical protein